MKALKEGGCRVYFPEFPNHDLNGAAFQHSGPTTGHSEDGIRKVIDLTVFEDSGHNNNNPAGWWEGAFAITPEMFGVEEVKVEFHFCGDYDETFILTPKA